MQTKPAVYLETSFVSYLAALPSTDVVTATRQLLSHKWWTESRGNFSLYVSPLVLAECRAGNPDQAARRGSFIAGLPILDPFDFTTIVIALMTPLGPIPPKAADDARHIAYAAFYGCEYLLTWNFRHLANALTRRRVDNIVEALGYEPPIICTPEELSNVFP